MSSEGAIVLLGESQNATALGTELAKDFNSPTVTPLAFIQRRISIAVGLMSPCYGMGNRFTKQGKINERCGFDSFYQ